MIKNQVKHGGLGGGSLLIPLIVVVRPLEDYREAHLTLIEFVQEAL